MVTPSRWRRAQQYEKDYWEQQAREISSGAVGQYEWYQWRANKLAERLKTLSLDATLRPDAKIIEVGSGPIGVAGFLPASEQLLVDPLEDFYRSNATLVALRNPGAQYRRGGGESLPADSAHYDLAIIENCIDHVQDDDAVLLEVRRVLAKDGILYLTVNCRTSTGFIVHRMLSRLRLDPGHPHSYTPKKLARKLAQHGFTLLDLQTGSYQTARREDLASGSSRSRLKARLGVSEFLASAIARKNAE